MDNLWASLANSGVFLAVLAGGYLLKRLGLFRREDAQLLSKIIMNITLPAAIVKGFVGVDLHQSPDIKYRLFSQDPPGY